MRLSCCSAIRQVLQLVLKSVSFHFLLVGNSPFANRGNEAIYRGTVAILRHAFGPETRITAASYGPREEIEKQDREDPAATHIALTCRRFRLPWVLDQLNRRAGLRTSGRFWMLRDAVKTADAALEIGGDNYSLDYGTPTHLLELDRYLLRSGLPLFLWGASVGPFDCEPEFEKAVMRHLRNFSGIYARETESLDYLRRNGLGELVRLVADPAFAMTAEEPPDALKPRVEWAASPVALNFSPLMARFVAAAKGSHSRWQEICVDAIVKLLHEVERPIVLVPHVFQRVFQNDDGDFLSEIAERVRRETGVEVPVVPRQLTSPQLKWVIGRCAALASARTHACLAAISSGVPVLSLAYSRKAVGINRDVFQRDEYCVKPEAITAESIAAGISKLLACGDRIREHLAGQVPLLTARAYAAGDLLRESLRAGA